MSLTRIASHILDDAMEVLRRVWKRGFFSGWICFKTHALNLSTLIGEHVVRTPRVECPCCGWQGYLFRAFDADIWMQPNAQCPRCLAFDRQRMLYLYLSRTSGFFSIPGRLLHFAPEPQIYSFWSEYPQLDIHGTDIAAEKLMPLAKPRFRADILYLPVPDEVYAYAVAIHVLEHIPDDREAMREIWRVLKPGGKAIIMVPINTGLDRTLEGDESPVLLYDHLRDYSPRDFPGRFEGFDVEVINPETFLGPEAMKRFNVTDYQMIYLFTKTPTT